jgi:hypothetical protein
MFGYIVPNKPELKIKDYELFRAYYCGVCRSIGKRHGHLKRLTLNYDSAFLAILLSAVANESCNFIGKRCPAHPFDKRHMIDGSEIVDYASDINILLAYYNLEDKKRDDGTLAPVAAMAALRRTFKKLRKKYTNKCLIMEERLNELVALEKEKCASMDMAAEPFAKLMEDVMAYEPLCGEEKTEQILRWIGYNLGKWIYLLDAYDDLEKDIKESNYNPLIYQYEYEGQDIGEFKKEIGKKIEFNLIYSLNQIAGAYELLDLKINKAILENIIYIGMFEKTEKILGMGSCKQVEESV